jgi:hypothetical protein
MAQFGSQLKLLPSREVQESLLNCVVYYRKVLFQLMYKICLTGFAHCAIDVKQLCWNRTNWKRQNLFNSNVLSTICKNQYCVEEGTKMVTSLVDGSLSEGLSRSFYNPSTRSKLKSFEDMAHKISWSVVVISIKDIDDNGCKLKTRDLIFSKIKCHLTKGSKPFCISSLVDSSLSEGQSRSFYNPSTRSKLKSFEDMAHKISWSVVLGTQSLFIWILS